ncbi:unnamed protein product [Urochloa decumbens]|uniref:DUF4220 domain-containing protein n=1 Tax=Urochloa decumbens TaxID=240449 RepID=A0ABC9FP33_9POAL
MLESDDDAVAGEGKPGQEMVVMVSVVAGLSLCLLRCILGPKRRRSSHWFVQYGSMAAHYLPSLIAFYVANALWSSSYLMLHAVWSVVLLLISSRGSLAMTAYSLNDSPVERWSLLKWIFYLGCLQFFLSTAGGHYEFQFITFVITCGSIIVVFASPKKPVAILEHNTKAFADYMRRESMSRSPFFDGEANSMHNSCKYPFMMKDGQWVDMKGLQQCSRLLGGTLDDGDIYLSYSFFQLLTRHYFGFQCAEEGDPKVRDFVLMELLQPDYKRAFSIVEVQLSLLLDYFFTFYHPITIMASLPHMLSNKEQRMKHLSFLSLLLSPAAIVSWLLYLYLVGETEFQVLPFAFDAVALVIFVLLVWFHLNPVVPMYWQTIRNAFRNFPTAASGMVYRPSFIEPYIQYCQRSNSLRQPYWQEKIGQYSLIKDYDSCSTTKACTALFKEHIQSEAPYRFMKHHPVQDDSVRLPESVRKLVAESVTIILQNINGCPTNGNRSLQKHGVLDVFGDTLRQETLTHTILIWHIATSYCEMTSSETSPWRNVATSLSKYCAYLVAFNPELLPDRGLETKMVLQQVLEEAQTKMSAEEDLTRIQQLLRKAKGLLGLTRMSMDDKLRKIQGFQISQDETSLTTFEKGIEVGQKLMLDDRNSAMSEGTGRWKLMADFWAETILYVAPSENAAAHIEQLVKGREFVTHLWALLSNAGILKRATTEELDPPDPSAPDNV